MRKMSWILVGCLLAGGALAEDWTDVIQSGSGTVWQVDRETILPAQSGISAWFRFTADHNLTPNGATEHRSGRAKRLFDCAAGRSADLAYDWYMQPNWVGAVSIAEQADATKPHWTQPRPGSIEDALMAFVCDYASRPENARP
jgi:hypothetical protein